MHAQQNTGETETGSFYVSAYIDVDSGYNAYGTSVAQSDDYQEFEYIGAEAYLTSDAGDIAYDSDAGWDRIEFSLSANGPVAPGHNYGTETDAYACSNDEEEGDYEECNDYEFIASAYANVYVDSPPPIIDNLSPSSANQGDQNTLIITGRNLVQSSSDQLTLIFRGP